MNNKIIFATATDKDNVPVVVLVISQEAYDYMRAGNDHTFDLTKAGIPIKLIIYGAPDHDTAFRIIQDIVKASGQDLIDMRGTDFGIKTKAGDSDLNEN